MNKKLAILIFLSMWNLSGCSSFSFLGGHFITSGKSVPLPSSEERPENSKKCFYHKGRIETCSFPYYIARSAGEISPLFLLVFFPISVGLDIAFSPLAFFWGIESGGEHWFMSTDDSKGKEKPEKKTPKQ